ncbi:extracellular solute-binding protein [Microbacterium gorillae]|uniref:extracellular solute-binding protein n=1 Tax=Microbacterium gorillae TaxID=1231063 RepID=UPI003D957202
MALNRLPRLIAGVAFTAAAGLALAGCAGDVAPAENSSTPDVGASSAAPEGTTAPSEGLTIYTGRDKDEVAWVVSEFEKEFPAYAGKVQTVIAGAQDNLDRMRAEAGNPQAGFLWGGTQQQFEQAADEGLLTAYTPKSDSAVPDKYKDPNHQWIAEMLLPEVIIYNSNLLTKDTAPQDWADLGKPEWKDKIVIRDVMASGTMRTIYASIVYSAFAKDGSPDAGYELLKQIDANTVSYAANPDDMYTQLDQGTGQVTVWNMQDALIQPLKNNRPWGYIMPSSGAPVLVDGVGIIKNDKQEAAAKDFMDFLMDPTMQAKLATDYYQIPAMDIPADQQPDWMKADGFNINEAKIDWQVFAEHQDEWMTYWADNIKGKGNS